MLKVDISPRCAGSIAAIGVEVVAIYSDHTSYVFPADNVYSIILTNKTSSWRNSRCIRRRRKALYILSKIGAEPFIKLTQRYTCHTYLCSYVYFTYRQSRKKYSK
jgi:hypothetical protein